MGNKVSFLCCVSNARNAFQVVIEMRNNAHLKLPYKEKIREKKYP